MLLAKVVARGTRAHSEKRGNGVSQKGNEL